MPIKDKFKSLYQLTQIDSKYKFTDDELKKQAQEFIGSDTADVYSIPYEFVGHNTASLADYNSPIQYQKNYPDWYRITPAYSIHYSGMTPVEHITSFWNPKSSNFVVKRARRWVAEDSTVIFCDKWDKIAMFAKMLVLAMTALIIIWQITSKAKVVYVVEGIDPNTTDPNERKLLDRAKSLSELEDSLWWKLAILAGSIVPTIVTAWNIYKRTTVPKHATVIADFNKGNDKKYNSRVMPKPIVARKHGTMVNTLANVSSSGSSIGRDSNVVMPFDNSINKWGPTSSKIEY